MSNKTEISLLEALKDRVLIFILYCQKLLPIKKARNPAPFLLNVDLPWHLLKVDSNRAGTVYVKTNVCQTRRGENVIPCP